MSENNINNPENINKICYELNDEALAINLNELEESKSPRGPSNTNLDLKEDFIIGKSTELQIFLS